MPEADRPQRTIAGTAIRWGMDTLIAAVVAAFTAGGAVAYFRSDVKDHEVRIAKLEAAEETTRSELIGRMRNIETFLAQLVCKQEGGASAACADAVRNIAPVVSKPRH